MLNNVNITTIINPLDLLAPHSCRGCGRIGTVLCDRCKNYILKTKCDVCPHCKSKTKNGICKNCPDLPPVFIIGERSGLLGNLIHDYKYNSVRSLSQPLAEIFSKKLPSYSKAYLVPLPTASHHIRSRGFDHMMLIAKRLSKLTNYKIVPILIRAKNTVQVGTDLETRKTQAKSAYVLKNTSIDQNATYILLDDVWTTGASMRASIKLLQQAGVKQIIVAILAINSLT